MRVLMMAIGSTGDVQPMVVLGKELIRRGHTATLCAFSALSPLAEGTGIQFVAFPGDVQRYIGELIQPGANPLTFLSRLENALKDVVGPLLDILYDACHGQDVLVTSFFGTTMYSIAEKLSLPLVQTNYCFTDATGDYCLPVMKQPRWGRKMNCLTYKLAYWMIDSLEKRYVYPWRESKGLPQRSIRKGPDYSVSGKAVPVVYAISEAVVQRPREWTDNIHISGFWTDARQPFEPEDALERFLQAGDMPVYIGFGSMTTGDARGSVDALVYALEKNGLRAVVSTGWGAMQAEALPDNIYMLDEAFVPHWWLFERVCAVVHHGGAGTTAAGLYAGKPSLVVPFGSDQYFWGDHVHACGCGPVPLPRKKVNGKRLAAAMHDLVCTPIYAENAQKVQAKLAKENGAANAVDVIENILKK